MRQITTMGALAALAAMSLDAAAQQPATQCVPALVEGDFELTLQVEGQEGLYRLTCRDGALVAAPVEPQGAETGSADATEAETTDAEAAIAETAADAAAALEGTEALDQPPAELATGTDRAADNDAGDRDTGINAAGVAGQTPEVSVTEAARQAAPTGSPAMAADDDAGQAAERKPAIDETQAAPDGEPRAAGEPKHGERLADGEADAAGDDRVPVPLVVIDSAELAVPGARFDSVIVEDDGDDRLYGLRGMLQDAAISVAVTPDGDVRQIDRAIKEDAVPDGVARIAEALLPGAEIRAITLSSRDNYTSFFVFEGRDVRDTPFMLEIRSDGRSVEFKRPS